MPRACRLSSTSARGDVSEVIEHAEIQRVDVGLADIAAADLAVPLPLGARAEVAVDAIADAGAEGDIAVRHGLVPGEVGGVFGARRVDAELAEEREVADRVRRDGDELPRARLDLLGETEGARARRRLGELVRVAELGGDVAVELVAADQLPGRRLVVAAHAGGHAAARIARLATPDRRAEIEARVLRRGWQRPHCRNERGDAGDALEIAFHRNLPLV